MMLYSVQLYFRRRFLLMQVLLQGTRVRFTPWPIFLLFWTVTPVKSSSADELPSLRDRVITAAADVLKAKARLSVLEEIESQLLKEAETAAESPKERQRPGEPDFLIPEQILKDIQRLLETTHNSWQKALTTLADAAHKQQEDALANWKQTIKASDELSAELTDSALRYGVNLEVGANQLWDVFLIVAPWGCLVVFVGLLMGLHEARRQLRRKLRANRSLATVVIASVLLLFASCTDTASPPTHPNANLAIELTRLREEEVRLSTELSQLQTSIRQLEETLDTRREEILTATIKRLIHPTFIQTSEEFSEKLTKMDSQAGQILRDILVTSRLTELVSENALRVVEDLELKQNRLFHYLATRSKLRYARIGFCGFFTILAFVPLAIVRTNLRKESDRDAEQCPRCLASGELELKTSIKSDPRYPDPQYLECLSCGYEFRESYRKLPRLCFPTVGIRGSGKTHWLVTAYDMIKNKNIPVDAVIQKAPSLADEEFDKMIEMVLEAHQGTHATVQYDIENLPAPLTFYVQDSDRLGVSAAILNLFDFSGELMDRRIATDLLRRRVLLMDGFILFLDPTQISKQGRSTQSVEDQIRALTHFNEELRDIRGLDLGEHLTTPVAVCVSKIDLLVSRNPLGGQAMSFIRELRASGEGMITIDAIRHRSKLLEQLLPTIFPGWDVRRSLKEYFGGRFLFFPLTPVGIEESELGIEDLDQRTFAPFGILEPILWLLHMHGYKIF